jgi:hypothetical protein
VKEGFLKHSFSLLNLGYEHPRNVLLHMPDFSKITTFDPTANNQTLNKSYRVRKDLDVLVEKDGNGKQRKMYIIKSLSFTMVFLQ